ncbi:FMN-dependent NADH-azoreductase [Priestia megaterium]
MTKVLYITANPKSVEESVGLTVGKAFIKSYKESHPNDEIKELHLYQEEFPTIDHDVINSWDRLRREGIAFSELDQEAQEKINNLNAFTDMVAGADKYVFVSPMWNWGTPPRLKEFIDSFLLVGKTFHYEDNGPVGHLKDKKAIHIQISGGIYSHGPFANMDHSHPYLKQVLNIVGIDDVDVLYVEGHEFDRERADEIIRTGISEAQNRAKTF